MPIAKVQAPDGRVMTLEVPDGATQEQIQQFAAQQFALLPPIQQGGQSGLDGQDIIGGVSGIAGGTLSPVSPEQTPRERALRATGREALGTVETATGIATGIVAEPVAGIAGLGQAINPFADPGAGARAVEETREALTFRPRTEAGQRQLRAVAETLEPVAEAVQTVEKGLGGAAFETTGSPTLAAFSETIPTLLTELIGGGTLKRAATTTGSRAKNIIKASPDGVQSSIMKAAEKSNVPVLTTDLFPPESYMGSLAQSIFEKLGPLGVGGARVKQQKARADAVIGLADEMGIDLDTPFADEMVNSIKKKNAQTIKKAGEIRGQAMDSLDEFGQFDSPRTLDEIDSLISEQQQLGEAANQTILRELQAFRTELEKPSDFRLKAALRTQMIKKRNQFARSEDVAPVAAIQKMKSALDKDMIAFARSNDKTATKKWLESNRKFAEEADITKRTGIKQILEKGDVTPERVIPILRGGKPSELNRLHNSLTEKGRAAARGALIQQALRDSRFFELDVDPNPNAVATALNKPNFQQASRVFFKGKEKAELDGLTRLLNATRKAQEGQQLLRTGEIATIAGGGTAAATAAIMEPVVALPALAIASGFSKAYESKPFRSAMLKIKNSEPGSRQELRAIEAVMPVILSSAQTFEEGRQ